MTREYTDPSYDAAVEQEQRISNKMRPASDDEYLAKYGARTPIGSDEHKAEQQRRNTEAREQLDRMEHPAFKPFVGHDVRRGHTHAFDTTPPLQITQGSGQATPSAPLEDVINRIANACAGLVMLTQDANNHADRLYGAYPEEKQNGDPALPNEIMSRLYMVLDDLDSRVRDVRLATHRNLNLV